MPIPRGVNKRVVVARETTYGTQGSGPGFEMRRVQSVLNFSKDSIQNDEILTSGQIRDVRHGVGRVNGQITGNLAPGSSWPLIESLLRRDFSASVNSGALVNVAAAAGPPGTFTRAAGSFVTDGFRVGDVVRWTGWATTGAANNNVNYRIIALTATVMTVAGTVAAKVAGDSVTCTRVGKRTFTPATGRTNPSFSIEHWFSDVNMSELFTGCRTTQMSLNIPATGPVPLSASIMGRALTTGASAVYSSPTAPVVSDAVVGATSLIRVNGADQVIVTGMQINMQVNSQATPVAGSLFLPDIFQGVLSVSGSISAYCDGVSLRDLFLNETSLGINVLLTNSPAANADFISIHLPRVKFMSADKNDSDTAIFEQFQFVALENTSSAANEELTTIVVQDSLVP
ncbi:phage tail tube protein [Falsiroseomonas sp. CW058]|uniref:phage tail tube protein n=1 Tax=Falsiroseomonas sp. CW058 TaxID=3388664 RepID=UPI003D31AF04